MEASRVEISPGLKVERSKPKVKQPQPQPPQPPPVQRTSSIIESSDSIPEFDTANVQKYYEQFKREQQQLQQKGGASTSINQSFVPNSSLPHTVMTPVSRVPPSAVPVQAPPAVPDIWASPELPILKTMDISKLFQKNQNVIPPKP